MSERSEALEGEIKAKKLRVAALGHEIRKVEKTAAHSRAVETRAKARQLEALQLSQKHLSAKPSSKQQQDNCRQQ